MLRYGHNSNKSGGVFDRDVPVIGTCASPVQHLISDGKQVGVHRGETEQMNSRLMYINLGSGLEREAVVECPPCLHCAAELYSEGKPV